MMFYAQEVGLHLRTVRGTGQHVNKNIFHEVRKSDHKHNVYDIGDKC